MHLVLVQLELDSMGVDVELTVEIVVGSGLSGEIEMTSKVRKIPYRELQTSSSCTYPDWRISSPAILLPIEQRRHALGCHHLQI